MTAVLIFLVLLTLRTLLSLLAFLMCLGPRILTSFFIGFLLFYNGFGQFLLVFTGFAFGFALF